MIDSYRNISTPGLKQAQKLKEAEVLATALQLSEQLQINYFSKSSKSGDE